MHLKRAWLVLITFVAIYVAIIRVQQWSVYKLHTELKRLEESDRQSPPPKDAVLFVGSSTIRLWQTLAEDFRGIEVIKRGFGGFKIADSTLLADRLVIPYKPTVVVLYAGENDLAAGKTPRQVVAAFKGFVRHVHRQLLTTKIAFISIKPSPKRASLLPRMKEANEEIKAYVCNDSRLIYIDVFTPMVDSDDNPRSELFAPDRLHMNKEGYNLWKVIIAPYIGRARQFIRAESFTHHSDHIGCCRQSDGHSPEYSTSKGTGFREESLCPGTTVDVQRDDLIN